ncbi:SprA-related family protein [Planctomycetes bacterium Pan216]|uniref:SprA-related family protein n=1 Tax=Kolteria novifilia TaxID=2527975 RepID=A0A518B990_9BACT|nr:SprA-related family protein [Planctomycetes bacterium Pan216]
MNPFVFSRFAEEESVAAAQETTSPDVPTDDPAVIASFSDEAPDATTTETDTNGTEEDATEAESTESSSERSVSGEELTAEEVDEVEQLEQRDREVRQHEQAHVAAGGQYVVGGPSYSYQQGPDGQRYAVGGEVQIDTAPEREPDATIRKMQQVRRAALAPAEPSAQDRSVAAAASRQEQQARADLLEEQQAPSEEETSESEGISEADSPREVASASEIQADEAPDAPSAASAQQTQQLASQLTASSSSGSLLDSLV